jgi:DNA-binding NarL/FixJ family response regulator
MKTILIADPDPAVGSALALSLRRRFGAEKIYVSRDLLTFAFCMADCAPRLLLFDPALYNATAFEACLLLRQVYPSLELVLLSSCAEDAQSAEKAGTHFLCKSASPEKMYATLAPLLME